MSQRLANDLRLRQVPPPVGNEASTRTRLQTDERRAQLLALGAQLFSLRSYEEISIDDIAAAAGISKGLLYHYFPSKRDFYVATIQAASQMLRRMTTEPAPGIGPFDAVCLGLAAHLTFVTTAGAAYSTLYRSGVAIDVEVGAILEEHRESVIRRILRAYGIAKPRPILRSALRAWLGMVEAASLDLIDHPTLDRNALQEMLIAGYEAAVTSAIKSDKQTELSFPKGVRA